MKKTVGPERSRRIVVIGGGTGTFVTLTGLKNYPVDLTAIVSMMDDGGSSGRLRDELGVLPPGDLRQCLVALSDSSQLLRDLFNYRYEEGGLKGHNFGNLLITALEKITSDYSEAVKAASEILRVKGEVVPVTKQDSDLYALLDDGTIVKGETTIDDEPPPGYEKSKIKKLYLKPSVSINPDAKKAINNADLIVVAPGDFYGSIMANFLVNGVPEAINKAKGNVVLTVNLMTRWGQYKFKVSDYVNFLRKYIKVDYLIINNQKPDPKLVKFYKSQHEFPVEDDSNNLKNVIITKTSLLNNKKIKQSKTDKIKRSLIRHDPNKLARAIISICKN